VLETGGNELNLTFGIWQMPDLVGFGFLNSNLAEPEPDFHSN